MTEISKAAARKASELAWNAAKADWERRYTTEGPMMDCSPTLDVRLGAAINELARQIQRASDVNKAYFATGGATPENLRRAKSLILPEEPADLHIPTDGSERGWVIPFNLVKRALDARGLKIVEADRDD